MGHRAQLVISLLVLVLCAACGDDGRRSGAPARTAGPPASLGPPASAGPPASPGGPVFYVAVDEPDASDDSNGRFSTYQGGRDGPWRTIGHAAGAMQAGDTTLVRGGTYYEAGIAFAGSGNEGSPITLAGYPGEEVVIDGSQSGGGDVPGIYLTPGQGHFVIQGFTIRNMGWSGIATDPSTTNPYEHITIRDCVLHDNGRSGIDLAAVAGFLVDGVEAYRNHYYGANIGASEDGTLSSRDGLVTRSSFHDQTEEEGHGLAINGGHNITFSDNVAFHNRIHGFDVSDMPKGGELTHDILVERNVSYDNGMNGFAVNSDSNHVVFRNNVAWQNGAAWGGKGTQSGFRCYEGCWHVEWDNNVSAENSEAGFLVTDELGAFSRPGDNQLVFRNNIAYANSEGALVVYGQDMWEVLATHNDLHPPAGQEDTAYDQGQLLTAADINDDRYQIGNVSVDPLFIDPNQPDFHLQAGSPLIDAGVDLGLPFCGRAPDIGAYERCP